MRVSDAVAKGAVFIGRMHDDEFEPIATGFFVGYPVAGGTCQYFVTAQHCVANKFDLKIRINTRNGQSEIYDLPSDRWYFHPDPKRFVDVAVMSSSVSLFLFDVVQISLGREAATVDLLDERDIGIGDEVFFPDLFIHRSGQGRNLPIVRTGTIAAMPDEPIMTRSGPINAYLIEGRSIGGHSGSPVFVNLSAPRIYDPTKPRRLPLGWNSPDYYLIGLIRGHLKAKDTGEYTTSDPATEDLWVNSGIATVIPAQDIWDTLNQPELEQGRLEMIKKAQDQSPDVPDAKPSASDKTNPEANPDHREDFTALLSEAAKQKPKGGQT